MKKILLLLLVSSFCYSQENYDTYETSYFKNKSFNIAVNKEAGKYEFWLDVKSMDKSVDYAVIKISNNKVPNFLEILDQLKAKYIEWKQVAEDNNVNDLSKELKLKSKTYLIGFKYGKYHFDNIKLKARFLIKDKVGTVMILENAQKLVSMSNEYIDSDGFAIVFSSVEEIDSLKEKLNLEKVKEFFEKKQKKKELFKQ